MYFEFNFYSDLRCRILIQSCKSLNQRIIFNDEIRFNIYLYLYIICNGLLSEEFDLGGVRR